MTNLMEIEKFEKLESNSTEQAVLKLMETPEGRENIFLCYYEWMLTAPSKGFILVKNGMLF